MSAPVTARCGWLVRIAHLIASEARVVDDIDSLDFGVRADIHAHLSDAISSIAEAHAQLIDHAPTDARGAYRLEHETCLH